MSESFFESGRLLITRHGETDANASGAWQGSTDGVLNERGMAQAQALAERLASEALAPVAIYASPLARARQTAEIVAQRVGAKAVQLHPGLAEFDLGEWEGLPYNALHDEKRLWERMKTDPAFAPPGGESAIAFATRVTRAFTEIMQRHKSETALITSHGGAIGTALAMLLDQDGSAWGKYLMANCALTELAVASRPRLMRFNDTAHLAQG